MSRGPLDIIDPVHGFVRAGEAERAVIDDPIFQRLRWIKQLSSAHLVYPGARHSRFEHSLGAMHVAGMAGLALAEAGAAGPDDVADLRLGGLLHDIGHGPFSHTFEAASGGPGHEEVGRRVVTGTRIADVLSSHGRDPARVAALAFGGPGAPRHLAEALSGQLSADMMDYLLRDGHFTGAEHARIDHRRITQSLGEAGGRLGLSRSALRSFESMVASRYQMFRAVYFHRTVRAAEVALLEAVRLASGSLGLGSLGLGEYLGMGDSSLMHALLGPGPGDAARRLARDYLDRRLPKCAYDGAAAAAPSPAPADPARLRSEIAAAAGVDESAVFVDSARAASVPLEPSGGEPDDVLLLAPEGGAGPVPLSSLPLVSALRGGLDALRVYAPAAERAKVEIAARRALGA